VSERVHSAEFHAADGAEAWRVLPEGAHAFFRTDSFAVSARFVGLIGDLLGEGLPPHVDIRADGVSVLLRAFKGERYGLDREDLELARRIAVAARDVGLEADPSAIQSLLIIPGAAQRGAIMPFWQAVLGYIPRPDSPDEDLVAAGGRLVRHNVEEGFWTLADPAGNEVDIGTTSAPPEAES
jgi:4a-hydroxytetrahydrobiopterin dehydratase